MVKQDLHVHTHLSDCGDRKAFIADYIKAAKGLGIERIGFSDHAWDMNIEGCSDWYKPQGYRRLATRYEEIKKIDTLGIDILLGAEGEYASFLLGISDMAAEFTDYILVPHSHTHMKGFVLPADCIGDPKKHGDYLVKSFISLCNHEKRNLFWGIVHPMYPIGEDYEYVKQLYSHISDATLEECALAAKEADMAIEANISVLGKVLGKDDNCYIRFYNACKAAGCKFFMGSDAHSIAAFNKCHNMQKEVLAVCGLNEGDFTAVIPRKHNG